MNLVKRLFERRTATLRDPDGWREWFGLKTAAGITVTPESALSHPAVLGAVRLLSEMVASLPLLVYERRGDGKRRAPDHPVYKLLHEAPNPLQTPFTFKEAVCLHLLLHGNAYLQITWRGDGAPASLWPIHPARVQVEVQNGTILYKAATPQGQTQTLTSDDILHIPLLAVDGIVGKSPVQVAREAIGAALAADQFAAGYFGNAARPSGILQLAGTLSQEALDRLKKTWQDAYGRGSQGTAVLEAGIEFKPVSGNANDSQLIETRQFSMRAIAAILRIPPHLLDPTARGTYANVETQSLEFLTFSLQPFLTRIEEALSLKLFTPTERQRFFAEFLTDGLLRADTRTRYTAYQVGIQAGFLLVDEVRQRENLPPLGAQRAAKVPEVRHVEVRNQDRKQDLIAKHRAKLESAYSRVAHREEMDVLAELLGADDLESAIRAYYAAAPGWIASELTPPYRALVAEAHEVAAEEAQAERWADTLLDEFAGVLAASAAARHAGIGLATLLPVLRLHTGDALQEAIEAHLAEATVTGPAKAAMLETVAVVNETALETYRKAGISKIMWQAAPNACEFCRQLDGRVVGIGEPFVGKGDSIPGPAGLLTARAPRVRPPVHLGCQCTLKPAL
ncbi:MAG: phage portal protein [Bacillota bacterium]